MKKNANRAPAVAPSIAPTTTTTSPSSSSSSSSTVGPSSWRTSPALAASFQGLTVAGSDDPMPPICSSTPYPHTSPIPSHLLINLPPRYNSSDRPSPPPHLHPYPAWMPTTMPRPRKKKLPPPSLSSLDKGSSSSGVRRKAPLRQRREKPPSDDEEDSDNDDTTNDRHRHRTRRTTKLSPKTKTASKESNGSNDKNESKDNSPSSPSRNGDANAPEHANGKGKSADMTTTDDSSTNGIDEGKNAKLAHGTTAATITVATEGSTATSTSNSTTTSSSSTSSNDSSSNTSSGSGSSTSSLVKEEKKASNGKKRQEPSEDLPRDNFRRPFIVNGRDISDPSVSSTPRHHLHPSGSDDDIHAPYRRSRPRPLDPAMLPEPTSYIITSSGTDLIQEVTLEGEILWSWFAFENVSIHFPSKKSFFCLC
jgi:hypothetical protein